MTTTLAAEAARRRTFAIISHPDAGKTTLTENMLFTAGAIRAAGAVRARGEQRRTRSDWMKIERERGISVSASVMTFEHRGLMMNLLDTPGHEDFSEDTYRTLTAADSAIMVLDAAKGIEPQTLKLFEVCRLRDIPILTFINKLDREAQDPFALLDEIQSRLALDVSPRQWPVGSGNRFKGVLDLDTQVFASFRRLEDHESPSDFARTPIDGNHIREILDDAEFELLTEEAELAAAGNPAFDLDSFRAGHLTPVYFGSGLRKFGVLELLDALAATAPPPRPVKAGGDRIAQPGDTEVSGFVFKVQANMDPNHRDRIAFLRLTSGRFRRGMKLKTTPDAKPMTVAAPMMFFAQDREVTDEAFAGDVIGVPNHGVLRVGDSLSETGRPQFAGLPNFAPEILRRARVADPLKAKHLKKALESLAEEGVTQLFRPQIGADLIVGAVGALQIDVMSERMSAEYGLAVTFEPPPFTTARWISSHDPAKLEDFMGRYRGQIAEDLDGAVVFLAKDSFEASYVEGKFSDIRFARSRERVTA